MKKRHNFNPKRRLHAAPGTPEERRALRELAERVRYGGNPEHKRAPGDFGLAPPSLPRQGKTLCDDARILQRLAAIALLKEGLERGLISVQARNGWPQNVWAVTADGCPLEAEREGDGVYHGYPMPEADPSREAVLARWNRP